MVVRCVCICVYDVYVRNIGSTVSCRGMFSRGTVHLLMTITKLGSDAFGPGCHQLATSTTIYASPCRHPTVGSCCGSGWSNKASRVSPRQTYWLPPKLFTENDKISTSPDRNLLFIVLVAHVDLFEKSSSPPERNISWPKTEHKIAKNGWKLSKVAITEITRSLLAKNGR